MTTHEYLQFIIYCFAYIGAITIAYHLIMFLERFIKLGKKKKRAKRNKKHLPQ